MQYYLHVKVSINSAYVKWQKPKTSEHTCSHWVSARMLIIVTTVALSHRQRMWGLCICWPHNAQEMTIGKRAPLLQYEPLSKMDVLPMKYWTISDGSTRHIPRIQMHPRSTKHRLDTGTDYWYTIPHFHKHDPPAQNSVFSLMWASRCIWHSIICRRNTRPGLTTALACCKLPMRDTV